MSPRQRRLLPYLSLLVIWVVWGSTYLFIRIAVREMPPFAAGFTRFMASGLVMAGVALWVDRNKERPTLRQVLDYALVGVLLLSIGNALVMWS
jgi:drug/metabolite transporter (DMT)-like permease